MSRISSAFSVASTPISQCSSQNSRNASLLDHNTSDSRHSPYHRSPSHSPQIRYSPGLLRDVTNTQWTNGIHDEKENDKGEAMDWDDSESMAQSTHTTRSQFPTGILARSREFGTTAQSLAPSVANMSIFGTVRPFDSPATPSVFSRHHRQMLQQQNVTPARSLFGAPRSMLASNVERTNYMPETK